MVALIIFFIAIFSDPCADRTTLYANGLKLINLCYINESLPWQKAVEKCSSIKYRLFEINTLFLELSAFNFYKSLAKNNEFRWINGYARNSDISTDWYVSNPNRLWNYTSNSWYGLVKVAVPYFCLGMIYTNNAVKFTQSNCQTFHTTFWCEYN